MNKIKFSPAPGNVMIERSGNGPLGTTVVRVMRASTEDVEAGRASEGQFLLADLRTQTRFQLIPLTAVRGIVEDDTTDEGTP